MDTTKLSTIFGLRAGVLASTSYMNRFTDVVTLLPAIIWISANLGLLEKILEWLFASVVIDESHELYFPVIEIVSAIRVKAKTQILSKTDKSARLGMSNTTTNGLSLVPDSETGTSRQSLSFEIPYGRSWFLWKYILFVVDRHSGHEPAPNARQGTGGFIVLRAFGLSTQSIQEFIIMARTTQNNTKAQFTAIYSLHNKHFRSFKTWRNPVHRLHRGMESITLDDSTKQSVVKDIGDFLQPSFAQMCQKNGIPWRRGYLLHGPPGTGKTSFVKAIAAYFQLDVYILSLQDSEMDDTELQNIFMTLPQKSIVLVEELDRISVARRKSKEVSFVQNGLEQNDVKFSLCGLLSSLDGFATAEGYILIVTSNRPELLDETLTRPGRIDRKIEFKLSTKASAMKMFVKIYEGKQANVHMLAKRFGDLIPDNKLSLARIQEFLLASNPEDAITRASVHNSNCEDG